MHAIIGAGKAMDLVKLALRNHADREEREGRGLRRDHHGLLKLMEGCALIALLDNGGDPKVSLSEDDCQVLIQYLDIPLA
ncbi:hypothetical protein [Acidisoma sp. 7E03]